MLGASLVDLGGAALLTEYPVCENDGELNQSGTPHGINRHGKRSQSGAERKGEGSPNSKRTEDCAEWAMVLPEILHGLLRASSAESGRERTATWIRSIAGRCGSGRGGRERWWGLELGDFGRLGFRFWFSRLVRIRPWES